jgi:predicted phosphodiesterase
MSAEARLFAISDVHVRFPANRALLEALPAHPNDGLIVAGDVAERQDDLAWTLETLRARFRSLYWVPGNHELWTLPGEGGPRGEAKYARMIDVCRSLGVKTPADPVPVWEGSGRPCAIALVCGLYDYTFAPDGIAGDRTRALAWAEEAGLRCTDEDLLHPDPYPSLALRSAAMCDRAEAQLDTIPRELESVLVNHFPVHRDHAVLPRIPRFSIWCGTRRSESWVERARARVVVFGHLHIPITIWRAGVRYEEVSLGYPKQWLASRAPASFLREIWPGPPQIGADGWRSRRAG